MLNEIKRDATSFAGDDGKWIVDIFNEDLDSNFETFRDLCKAINYPSVHAVHIHHVKYHIKHKPDYEDMFNIAEAEHIVCTEEFVKAVARNYFIEQVDKCYRKISFRSSYPVRMTLEFAAIFKKISSASAYSKYAGLSESMSESAVRLLEAISTPQKAAWTLSEHGFFKTSPIQACLLSENGAFAGSSRLQEIVNDYWWRGIDVTTEANVKRRGIKQKIRVALGFLKKLVTEQENTVRRSDFRYFIENFMFFVMVVLLSAIHVSAVDPFHFPDYISAVFCVGTCLELYTRYNHCYPRKTYFNSAWNILDLCLVGCWIPSLLGRAIPQFKLLFVVSHAFFVFLLWLRMMALFRFHDTLGPLLISVQKMLRDIFHFILLSFCLVVGFTFAFQTALASADQQSYDGYKNRTAIFYTLLKNAFTGDSNFDIFEVFGNVTDIVYVCNSLAILLSFLYLVVTAIVLVNLLIAMMGNTYGAVGDNVADQYALIELETIMEYDNQGHGLIPPPFNVFGLMMYQLVWPCVFKKTTNSRVKQKFCNYCWTEMKLNKPNWTPKELQRYMYVTEPDCFQTDGDKAICVKRNAMRYIKNHVCSNCHRVIKRSEELFTAFDVAWCRLQTFITFLLVSVPISIAGILLSLACGILLFPFILIWEFTRTKKDEDQDAFKRAADRTKNVMNQVDSIKLEKLQKDMLGQLSDNVMVNSSSSGDFAALDQADANDIDMSLFDDLNPCVEVGSARGYKMQENEVKALRCVFPDDSAMQIPYNKAFPPEDKDEIVDSVEDVKAAVLEGVENLLKEYGLKKKVKKGFL